MGLGVLDDTVLSHVPGTIQLEHDLHFNASTVIDGSLWKTHDPEGLLKYDRSGKIPILLDPQPSDDPNDPLNWPQWRRDAIVFCLTLAASFTTGLNSILASNVLTMFAYYNNAGREVDIADMAELTGYFLLGIGIGGIFSVPSSRVFGKRHMYMAGVILATISSIWSAASGANYTSMAVSRVFQGIGTAPFESLVNVSVGDLYPVHQRGKRMALTNLAIFGSAFFTPVVVGNITFYMGVHWPFWFEAIFIGCCIPLVYFCIPETSFNREKAVSAANYHSSTYQTTDMEKSLVPPSQVYRFGRDGEKDDEPFSDIFEALNFKIDHKRITSLTYHVEHANPAVVPKTSEKRSYRQSLALFNGRFENIAFWKLILRPFPLFFQPAVFWASLIQGCMIAWTVFTGVVIGVIFYGPPLFWNEVNTGYAYAAGFVGAVIGFAFAGVFSDSSVKWLTKRNNGVFEPEFRIFLVTGQLVFGCVGAFGFGITASDVVRYGWFVPIMFFGMVCAAMVVGAVACSLYIVDAYSNVAIEAFTTVLIFKNFFSYGIIYRGIDWWMAAGTLKLFIIVGSLTAAICALSIPMYVLGKRNRSFWYRHDMFMMLRLD